MIPQIFVNPGLRSERGTRFRMHCGIAVAVLLAAATLVAFIPSYWPVSLLQAGGFALVGWCAVQYLTGNLGLRSHVLFWFMAAAALWGPLQMSIHQTVLPFATGKASLFWAANAAFVFVALQVFESTCVRERFLEATALFGALLTVAAIVQYYTSPTDVYWLFPSRQATIGPFVYKNQFAAFLELIFPIALYRMLTDKRQSILYAIAGAFMAAAVVASASRAGTLIIAAEAVVILALGWQRKLLPAKRMGWLLLQMIALLALFTAVVGWQSIWSHVQQENPYLVRGKLFQSTVAMAQDRPLTGFGLGTWQTVYPAYATFDNALYANQAHNDWAQWAAEGGLPFVLFLAATAGVASLLAWRYLWGLGVTAVFIHSFVDYPTREPVIGALLFTLTGAMAAASWTRKRRRSAGGAATFPLKPGSETN